jgi:hypothetical protein
MKQATKISKRPTWLACKPTVQPFFAMSRVVAPTSESCIGQRTYEQDEWYFAPDLFVKAVGVKRGAAGYLARHSREGWGRRLAMLTSRHSELSS